MSRIRWKLLTAMITVVIVTVGLSGVFTRRVTHDQVRRLILTRVPSTPPGAVRPIEEHYRSSGWKNIDATVDRVAAASRRRLVVTDAGGNVMSVSKDMRKFTVTVDAGNRITTTGFLGGRVHLVIRTPPMPLRDHAGRLAGRVYVLPPEDSERAVEFREISALDRRLIVTFAMAALVAVLLTFLISRRITRPIERLTAAVREMTRGEVPARVEVSGHDEMAQLATSFNSMADTITAQQELRRRMVGDVAHELRTPLTNLRCELEAIQDGLSIPDAARISSIHEEVLHLQRLVEDLQELAVAEAGGLQLQKERIEVATVVARVLDLFRPEAARRGIEIDFASDDHVFIDADATRIGQIVRNLLSNAIHHTPDGGRVHVTVRTEASNALVSIADSGSGIPAAELERVFERFYRLDEGRGRDTGGAGLGLAIVRSLVELHGGRVWAESPAGSGATFTFTIPIASS